MSLGTYLIFAAIMYGVVGFVVFFLNITSMPVTFGLAVLRGALWPLLPFGLLRGEPMPMD